MGRIATRPSGSGGRIRTYDQAVEPSVAGSKLDFELVERLGAQPVRPPQIGIHDIDRDLGARPTGGNGRLDGIDPAVRMRDLHRRC